MKKRDLRDRFLEKFVCGGVDDCWEWKAFIHPSGYGMINSGVDRGRKMLLAHRVSWEVFNGDIPLGMLVCHKCDNRICVNPSHLFLGTFQENIDDRDKKNRGRIPDNSGENHGMSKLKTSDVLFIRSVTHSRKAAREISKKLGVSSGTIWGVWTRRSWKHLK